MRTLAPLRQGDLDGLCGLYAITNAIRIVLYPERKLRRHDLQKLMRAGLAILSRTRTLRRAVSDGMDDLLWTKLCDAVLAEAALIVGGEFVRSRLVDGAAAVSARDMVRSIKRSIRQGAPVLIELMGRYDHWTLAVAFGASRLSLFDSYGYYWVLIASLGVDDRAGGAPHRIHPASLISLRYQPG